MINNLTKSSFNPKDSGLILSITILTINIIGIALIMFTDNLMLPEKLDNYLGIAVTQLTILFTCIFYCNYSNIDIFRALHISKKPQTVKTIVSILIGLSMMFVLIVPILYFIEFLESLGYVPNESSVEIKTISDLILGTIFIAIFPAICEEIMFRGIVLQGLRRFGDVFAIFFSAIMFMLFHTNPSQTLYPLLSGLVLGLVFVKTGDLKYTMIIHFFNNFINILLEFIANNSELINQTENITTQDIIIIGISTVIFALCLIYLLKQKSIKHYLIKPKVFRPQNIFYNGMFFNMAFERYLFEKQNKINEPFTDYENIQNKQQFDNGFENAENLLKNNFAYDYKKITFVLYDAEQTQITAPQGFTDESKNPKYNPYATTKPKYFLYSLFGIIMCVALWITVFFS